MDNIKEVQQEKEGRGRKRTRTRTSSVLPEKCEDPQNTCFLPRKGFRSFYHSETRNKFKIYPL